jgi:RNA recognition motif-containing protein
VSFARPNRAEIRNANLYVSNLPDNVTSTAALEELFCGYGNIVTSRLLLDKNFKPRGVGFVRFNLRHEATAAVVGLNGVILKDNCAPLLVKFAKNAVNPNITGLPKFAAPPLMPKASNPSNGLVLHVNNIGPEIDESSLMALFSNCGRVLDLSIIRNNWHRKRNFAIVTMHSKDSANFACQSLNGYVVGSKAIGVVFKDCRE